MFSQSSFQNLPRVGEYLKTNWLGGTLPFRYFNFYRVDLRVVKKTGFCSKQSTTCRATLDPAAVIPNENNVIRSRDSSALICLESDGLLRVVLNFEVSDRKSIGIRSQSRQLSVLYKVTTEAVRDILNIYNVGNVTPLVRKGVPFIQAVDIVQELEVIFNGERYEFQVSQAQLGGDFFKPAPYLKFISMETMRLAQKRGNFNPRHANLTVTDLSKNNNLFMIGDPKSFFKEPEKPKTVPITQALGMDDQGRGRKRVVMPKSFNANIPTGGGATSLSASSVSGLTNSFVPFDKMPITVNLLEAAGSTISQFPEWVIEQAKVPVVYRECVTAASHVLVIQSRKTMYRLKVLNSASDAVDYYPMVFEYFEDGEQFTRVFVTQDYLGACLHKVLFQHIQEVHSSRISYKSIRFTSFEKKEWFSEGTTARKSPLKEFSEIDCPFNALQTGTNPRDIVNVSANLLFTTNFENSNNTFFRTNRFITCSCFQTPNDVKSAAFSNLWSKLENGFGSEVILSDGPLVSLVPAFERGQIIETGGSLYFRGLVSNAGTVESVP